MFPKGKINSGWEGIQIFGVLGEKNSMTKVERKAKTSLMIIHIKK